VRFYAVGYQREASCYPDDEDRGRPATTARAIVQAVDDGARIITLTKAPLGPDGRVAEAVAYALHHKVIVVVGSGQGLWGGWWVSQLNGVVAVGAYGPDGAVPECAANGAACAPTVLAPGRHMSRLGGCFTNSAAWDDVCVEDLPSTDMAAALVAGMLADVAQRWPDATGGQLIQTLIRNTGSADHELVYGDRHYSMGYGAADLAHMLRVDPTGYEDSNPLIVDDDGLEHGLTAEDIRTAVRPTWTDQAVTDPSPAPSHRPVSRAPLWVGLLVAAVVVLVLGVLVAVRRRTRVE